MFSLANKNHQINKLLIIE